MRTTTPALHAGDPDPELQLPQPGREALRGGPDLPARRRGRPGRRAQDPLLGAYGGDMDFYAMKGVIEAILKTCGPRTSTSRDPPARPVTPPTTPAGWPTVWPATTASASSARSTPWWPRTTAWTPNSTARSCSWTDWPRPRVPIRSTSPAQVPLRGPGHRRGLRQGRHCGRSGGVHPQGCQGPAEACGTVRHLHRRRHSGGQEVRGPPPPQEKMGREQPRELPPENLL